MDKEDEEKMLVMMNGFIDLWNGICDTNLPKFKSKEDVDKFTDEIKRLEENALNNKKRGNNG